MKGQLEEAKKLIKTLAENMLTQLNPLRAQLVGQEVVIRNVPDEFERDKDGIITRCSWIEEQVTRESYLGINTWIVKFEDTEDFKRATERIAELMKIPHETVSHPLGSFLLHIGVHGLAEDDMILLLDDLEGMLPSWQVIARLRGIVPADEEATIRVGIKLRKVNKEDLISEVTLLHASYFGIRDFLTTYHSILELSIARGTSREVQETLEKVLVLLSLYREGALSCDNYTMKPKSFRSFGGGTLSKGMQTSDKPRIVMTQQDVRDAATFIEKLETRLPMAVIFGQPIDPLEISLKRYLHSLRMIGGIEEKLTYAVMGMESLFLKAQPEAQFRLAIRAARVLGHLNEDPSVVYSNILEAYRYRSLHVHGSVLKAEQQKKANEVFDRIVRYLRKVLLFWLMEGIVSEAKKEQFLREVDAALIDENRAQNLKSRLTTIRDTLKSAF